MGSIKTRASRPRPWAESFERFDIRPVADEHYARLRDYDTGEKTVADFALFKVFPVIVAVAFFFTAPYVSKDAAAMVATAVSILGGLLFQLLVLIYTLADKVKSARFPDGISPNDPEERRIKARKIGLLRDAYSNIGYGIMLALLALAVLLVGASGVGGWLTSICHGSWIVIPRVARGLYVALTAGLTASFMVTLFVILRRMHILMVDELDPA